MNTEKFIQQIKQGYSAKGESIYLGAGMVDGIVIKEAEVKIPLKTLNRHGLIAGATGTGKTKTIQKITEALSEKGVPVLMMDIKGDFSGIAKPGDINDRVKERANQLGIEYKPKGFPVEFLSLSDEKGARIRATVTEFGPVLFSRILGLNDTQTGVVSLIFKYCDDHGLPLVDLKDFKKVLQYLTNEARQEIEKEYGKISSTTTATIIRKTIELEQQGGEDFFGERSFDVNDLTRIDENGYGMVNIIRLTDVQSKPKLFSTFMLCLLAEMYSAFPEEGDLEAPKLVMFLDEAHLIFQDASKELMDQLEIIIKLIRSKGIGIFFCTQNPNDIPPSILSQLGLKVQHALRAFTAADRKAINKAAENFPLTEFYKTDETLTSLGIGEAFVTALNEKGIPTPLVAVMMSPPESRMNVLSTDELEQLIKRSTLVQKYNEVIDRESAFEMLNQRINTAAEQQVVDTPIKTTKSAKPEKSTLEKVLSNPMAKTVGNTLMRELTRGLLGVLGITTRKRKR